jgi:hypothetical protein
VETESDRLTREIADLAAEITQLKSLIDEQAAGASDEWIAAAHRALRLAHQRLRNLQAVEGHVDRRILEEWRDPTA